MIRAFRFAMRCTPIASDSVTVGRSPSGTNATTIPTEKMNPSLSGRPITNTERKKSAIPIPSAITVTKRVTRLTSFCSGDRSSSTVCVMRAILPNSVFMPVAKITARPVPALTAVPANTRFGRSMIDNPSRSEASAVRRAGVDSPFRVERSTRISLSSTRRASALTWSPSERTMTSPGTSSSAGTFASCPSRTTRANCGKSILSASAAFSARNSCQNEKIALITMTAQIAQPSCGILPTKAIAPPAQRRRAMRWVKFARNLRHKGFPLIVWIAFGPTLARRVFASAVERPSADVPAAA